MQPAADAYRGTNQGHSDKPSTTLLNHSSCSFHICRLTGEITELCRLEKTFKVIKPTCKPESCEWPIRKKPDSFTCVCTQECLERAMRDRHALHRRVGAQKRWISLGRDGPRGGAVSPADNPGFTKSPAHGWGSCLRDSCLPSPLRHSNRPGIDCLSCHATSPSPDI